MKRFLLLLPLAALLAAQPKITTPKDFLGFNLGDDYHDGELYPARRVLAQDRDGMRPLKLVDIGPDRRRPAPVHDDHHFAEN